MAMHTHLSRRGAAYVWRRTLPKGFAGFGKTSDFRLSTRCHLPPEAARRARRLDVAFDGILEAVETMLAEGLTLSSEEVNAIVRHALQRVLDEAETARALAGPRDARAARAAAAVSQHALEITVADRELQVLAHRPHDHLRRELPTLERALPAAHHRVTPAAEKGWVLPDRYPGANAATEPPLLDLGGELAVADPVPAVPANRPEHDLAPEVAPLDIRHGPAPNLVRAIPPDADRLLQQSPS